MSSYSRSPYRLPHTFSPARSTPSLDDNLDDSFFSSPPDIYLDTPDLPPYDWKEIRKLEDRKLYLEEREAALGLYVRLRSRSRLLSYCSILLQDVDVELPSLADVSRNKAPLLSESSPAPSSWQPSTISPAEVFYDYDDVRQFLAEQARPSSPSVYSACSSSLITPYTDTKDLPSVDDDEFATYPAVAPPSDYPMSSLLTFEGTSSTTKRSREEDDDDDYDSDEAHENENEVTESRSPPIRAPPPKRPRLRSDDVADYEDVRTPEPDQVQDDDDSGEFKLRASYATKKQKSGRAPRRSVVKSNSAHKSSTKSRQTHTHSKEDTYRPGPCDCRQPSCASCEMTCWYTFIRGPKKGQVCRRLFESGRHLDLRRHKISHAVNEWQMVENGEVTLEEAWWYAVKYNCEHKGLICPNGDCTTTFTRYDALRRHMERQTCPYWQLSPYSNLDSRNVKAQIERDSGEKYARISTSKRS